MSFGTFLVDILIIAFALVVSVSGLLYFLHKGHTLAEAGAYGLMAMLMLQSWTAQVLFMTGAQRFQPVAQGLLIVPALALIHHRRRMLSAAGRIGLRFAWDYRLPAFFIGCGIIGLTALNFKAFLHPHTSPALTYLSNHWHARGSLFSSFGSNPLPAVVVLNHAILLAPWQPAVMAQAANLCAWLAIALCTYALARRYAWPGTAATVALLVVSMPRVLHQVCAPYSELLPSAAALVAVLALYRSVEEPHSRDLSMLAAAICFSVAGGRLSYLMPSVLILLSLIVLGRRHHVRLWPGAILSHPAGLTAALAAGLVFSQIGGVFFNLFYGQTWIGVIPGDDVVFNSGGIAGAGANLVRYLLQSIHLPDFIDAAGQKVLGFSPLGTIRLFYEKTLETFADGRGAAVPFSLSWNNRDPFLWFGPAGFFLILPSMVYAMRKGPRRLKNTASALSAYFFLIALILAWRPQNVSLMTPFFVCCGFCIAFFLPPWRVTRNGRLVLQLTAVLIGIYALL